MEQPIQLRDLTTAQAEEKYPGPTEFCHLHNHTIFSMLDGVAQPEEYFKACFERKWPAFAITEHGVLSSIPDAYNAAKKYGIKQIVGVEIYYNDYELQRQKHLESGGKVKDLEISNPDLNIRMRRNRHLTVLCKNMQGYENLLKINNYAVENGFFYKPRVWFDSLAKHKDGLIILSGCLNGPVAHELRFDNFRGKPGICGATEYVNRFKSVFGDDYYIELQMPGIEGDVEVFRQLVALADYKKIKLILANDSHYMSRKDFEVQKVMMAIDQGTTIDDPELFHVNSDEQFFKTRAELRATFMLREYSKHVDIGVFETACNNTLEIADKCSNFKPNLESKLPKIENATDKLVRAAFKGLCDRGLDSNIKHKTIDGEFVTYKEQMILELKRFKEKSFDSYFLISKDLVDCSVAKGWPLGPARGSAGGSLVCFLIGIHTLDPIKWGLSFNRFLGPARGGKNLRVLMPDE